MSAKVLKWNDMRKAGARRWHWEHRLCTGSHQVHRPFEHPHHLMYLSIARFRVLSAGEHIKRRTIVGIVTKQDLFPCDELWRAWSSITQVGRVRRKNTYFRLKIFGGVGVQARLSSPFQGGLEPLDSFRYVPFCSPEIPL